MLAECDNDLYCCVLAVRFLMLVQSNLGPKVLLWVGRVMVLRVVAQLHIFFQQNYISLMNEGNKYKYSIYIFNFSWHSLHDCTHIALLWGLSMGILSLFTGWQWVVRGCLEGHFSSAALGKHINYELPTFYSVVILVSERKLFEWCAFIWNKARAEYSIILKVIPVVCMLISTMLLKVSQVNLLFPIIVLQG